MAQGRLADQVAIVTGGSRGIGRAICRAYVREGARVVVAALNQEGIDLVVAELRSAAAEAIGVVADVTDPAGVAQLVQTALAGFGRIDILVNNAGIYRSAPFLEYSLAEWQQVFNVNVHGTFLCTQAVLPHLLAAGRGKIINISSTAGKWGSLYQSAYNASKHAIMGLTRSLALEVAAQGVTVNAICPGLVETDMGGELLGGLARVLGGDEAALALMRSRVPQGRFVRPEEVADLAVYLGSPESDGMTGVGITLAGGMVLI